MPTLKVTFPFKRFLRNKDVENRLNDSDSNGKSKASERNRIREYRKQLKTDPSRKERADKLKVKKKVENQSYSDKVNERRKNDLLYDERIKQKNRERKQIYRKKKAKARKKQLQRQTEEAPPEVKRTSSRKKIDPTSKSRKRAERVRKSLPEDSEGWANTVNHILKDATPKRKSLINLNKENHSELKSVISSNKPGRPSKSRRDTKRKLAFSDMSERLWSSTSLGQYKRRKNVQVKKLKKKAVFRQAWQSKIESFLENYSRIMPNKKDTIHINGAPVAKHHILINKADLYKKFKQQNPSFTKKYTTFSKLIPKQYRNLNLKCRRVCVCTKDYNLEKKVEGMNRAALKYGMPELKSNVRGLSRKTVCQFEDRPHRQCVDRLCQACGIENLKVFYLPLVEKADKDESIIYHQWEKTAETYVSKEGKKIHTKRWIQAEKKVTVGDLVDRISANMKLFTGHIYRSDYQHMVESQLMSDLPIDQVLVVMDFSENISLTPQDEIESAHWAIKQVTLHPIFIVRHAPESTLDKPVITKESLIIVSDSLAHNADSEYVFTDKLISHLRNNPGPCDIKTIHRFSDNCSVQYKCKDAFSHLSQLEEKHATKIVYHYTESGHGKGPSDGLGAAVKMRLQRLILGEQKVVNNAYQVYLALTQNVQTVSSQKIVYVPQKEINKTKPKKVQVKTIHGTQSNHMFQTCGTPGGLKCSDLSCACQVCVTDQEGPCYYRQFRHIPVCHDLFTGKRIVENTSLALPNSGDCVQSPPVTPVQIDDVVIQQSRDDYDQHVAQIERQIEQAMHEFTVKVSQQGWKIRDSTPMDGNCFFWAVSDQLTKVNLCMCTFML